MFRVALILSALVIVGCGDLTELDRQQKPDDPKPVVVKDEATPRQLIEKIADSVDTKVIFRMDQIARTAEVLGRLGKLPNEALIALENTFPGDELMTSNRELTNSDSEKLRNTAKSLK